MKNSKLHVLFSVAGLVFVSAFWAACGAASPSNNNASNSGATKVDVEARQREMFAKAPQGASPANSKGAPNALVTIEEFADFQCPTCGSMHPKVQEIRAAYGERVRIIFREFPLQGHIHGYDAACAAEAAGLQGKFWDMQNKLFTNQSAWSNAQDVRKIFTDYAGELGLDAQKFSDDMLGLVVKNRVDADLVRGRALGISSTPTFFINNRLYDGDLNSLRTAVDTELKRAESAATQGAPANNTNSSQTKPDSNAANSSNAASSKK